MIFKIVYGKEIHVLNKEVGFGELQAFVRSAFKKLPKNYTLSYVDAEGDNIAITSQNDIEIISLGQGSASSIRILINEVEEEKAQDRSFEEIDDVIEVKSVVVEDKKLEPKSEPALDIAAMIQSRISEIIPEITKQITDNVTNSMIKSTVESKVSSEEVKKPSSQVVHNGVTCDSCGKFPIVGIRYKCSICHNYDFCEECEARGDHPHAFLKIRTPAQAPRILIASMEGEAEGIEVNGKFMDSGFFKNIFDTYAPKIPEFVEKFKSCARRSKKASREEKVVVPPPFIPSDVKEDEDTLFNIFEVPKKEEPKKEEIKKEEPKKEDPSMERERIQDEENRQLAVAYELEQILEADFFKMLRFVKKFPKLSKEELIEKYLQRNS